MPNLRLIKNDSEDIGFVDTCLVSGIVIFDEFKQWLFMIIESEDEVPSYFWDLVDLREKFDFKPLQIMGFNPHWSHNDDEYHALDGIGYKRRPNFISDAASRTDALKKLSENPHIEDRFRTTFPFIEF